MEKFVFLCCKLVQKLVLKNVKRFTDLFFLLKGVCDSQRRRSSVWTGHPWSPPLHRSKTWFNLFTCIIIIFCLFDPFFLIAWVTPTCFCSCQTSAKCLLWRNILHLLVNRFNEHFRQPESLNPLLWWDIYQ